jgi:hypothetical protein
MLELQPYLNPKYKQPPNPSRSIVLNVENQHSPINFSPHIFETSTIIEEQKHISALLMSTNIGFHTFQGPLGNDFFFGVKYLIHQLQLESKKLLLLTITT